MSKWKIDIQHKRETKRITVTNPVPDTKVGAEDSALASMGWKRDDCASIDVFEYCPSVVEPEPEPEPKRRLVIENAEPAPKETAPSIDEQEDEAPPVPAKKKARTKKARRK